jgi:error-prone DNA polymerase
MGFYSPGIIVNDLRRHGIKVLPVDVQFSRWDCTLENGALRLGLRMVRGLGEETGRSIEKAQQSAPFSSIEELSQRANLPSKSLTPLAAAGALRSLYDRRTAIWKSSAAARQNLPLFVGVVWPEPEASLPPMKPLESIAMDSYYAGAFTGEHPMKLARPSLQRQHILRAADLAQIPANTTATVAGLVITRQRPAAKGFVFLTLEDETGHTDIAVSPSSFKRFQDTIRLSEALIIRGRLITDGDARNIAAEIIVPLRLSENIHVESHDFH